MLPGKGDEKAQQVQNLATKPLTPNSILQAHVVYGKNRPLKLSSDPHVFTYSHIIKKISKKKTNKKKSYYPGNQNFYLVERKRLRERKTHAFILMALLGKRLHCSKQSPAWYPCHLPGNRAGA